MSIPTALRKFGDTKRRAEPRPAHKPKPEPTDGPSGVKARRPKGRIIRRGWDLNPWEAVILDDVHGGGRGRLWSVRDLAERLAPVVEEAGGPTDVVRVVRNSLRVLVKEGWLMRARHRGIYRQGPTLVAYAELCTASVAALGSLLVTAMEIREDATEVVYEGLLSGVMPKAEYALTLSGRTLPSPRALRLIARYLKVEPSHLLALVATP